jgi:type I restriction enzyme S subunit
MAARRIRKTVGDYVKLQRGNTYSGKLVGEKGPALLGLGSIEPGGGFRYGKCKTFGGECPAKIMVRPGEIYVALKGATKDGSMVGSVARLPADIASGRLTQDTARLDLIEQDKEIADHLYWVLRTPQYRQYCNGRLTGSASASFSREDFLSYPVPPITSTSKVLATLLEHIERKIELNRQMNLGLENTARAIFKSWFVDFDPVRAKAEGRQPAGMDSDTSALFPAAFYPSPFGRLPRSWSWTQLGGELELLEVGSRPKGGAVSDGVPSIGAESIVGLGQFDYSKTKFVPLEFFLKMGRGLLQSGDVLVYKDGGRPGEYEPHITIFGDGFPFERCCINEHVYRVRAKSGVGQPYLYFWLTTTFSLDQMRIRGTGVAIPGLNSTAFRSLPLLLPKHAVCEAFNARVAPFLNAVFQNSRQSRTLTGLRDALLPKLLSGELRIRDAEKLVETHT